MLAALGWRVAFVTSLAALVSWGCKRDAPRERSEAPPAPAATATVHPSPEELVKSREREARARALLDDWVRAQNAGDFAAYEALYAERFTGIKRVGPRMQRFDRPGWLDDRKALFQRPFSVGIDDVRVTTTQASAIVLFTQSWSSAAFRDVGTKQLVLAAERGALRIASEEMKNSDTGGATRDAGAPKPQEFSFVALAPDPLLILSTSVPGGAVQGPPRYVSDRQSRRSLVSSALSADWQALLGTKFTLYKDGGAACDASVVGFEALASLQVHFGTESYWRGEQGNPVVSPEARALDLWEHSEQAGRFLVARLDAPGDCQGARWARASSLPPPSLWSSRPPSNEERAAILRAVRATKLYRELQAEFEAALHESTPWDDSGNPPLLTLFEDGRGQTFASLTARSGVDDACDSPFDVDVLFLLQRRGSSFSVVSAPPSAHVDSAWPRFLEPLRAEVAFDLEGDGRPEFVGWMDFLRESAGAYRSVLNRSPGYFSCPC